MTEVSENLLYNESKMRLVGWLDVCKRSLGWINYDNYVHITHPMTYFGHALIVNVT